MSPIIYRDLRITTRLATDASAEAVDPYTFDVVASDESIDAHGTIVRGWKLDRFQRNPVVLFAHDPTKIVGKAANVRLVDGVLTMTITLAKAGTSAIVDEVRSLREQDMLRGISVGMNPSDLDFEEVDGRDVLVLLDNELLETTLCAVGSNANALAELRALATANRPASTPRSPMSTAKKPAPKAPVTRAPEEEKKKIEGELPPKEEKAANGCHDVYVAAVGGAIDAVEGLDDAQRAAVHEAVNAALASALAEVGAMEGEGGAVEEAARSVPALTPRELAAEKRAVDAEKRAETVERGAIIQRAKDARQWSPGQAPFLAALPLPLLRTWQRTAPAVVPGGEVEPPDEAATDDTQLPTDVAALATKGWSKLTDMERHAVHAHNPKLAERLRAAARPAAPSAKSRR